MFSKHISSKVCSVDGAGQTLNSRWQGSGTTRAAHAPERGRGRRQRGTAMINKISLEEIQTLETEIAIKLNEIHISKTELDTLAETHKESLEKVSAKLREDLARLRDLAQQYAQRDRLGDDIVGAGLPGFRRKIIIRSNRQDRSVFERGLGAQLPDH